MSAPRNLRTVLIAAAAILFCVLGALGPTVQAEGEGGHAPTHDPDHHGDATHGAHAGEHGDAHAADAHGGGHHEGPPELDNIFNMLGFPHGVTWLNGWVGPDQLFMLFYIVVLVAIAALATRSLEYIPGPLQNGVEAIAEGLDDFVQGILGPKGRQFVPFLGTLFIYILFMNYSGLVPFLKAPTNNLNTTLALALCVFLYVQWTGIRSFGVRGYLDHMAGEPRDLVGWILVPLMMPLHVVGELVKPISLALRLFGNITGEDVLLAVFVGLGGALYAATKLPGSEFLGIPLQAIIYPLLLIFGLIQALVFTLLSTIYFYMMLPHEEHH